MSELFEDVWDNLKNAFWTGAGKSSEQPQEKKPSRWLVICIRLLFLAVLGTIAKVVLQWLGTMTKEHPLEISFVLLVAISALFLEMWLRWKIVGSRALVDASESGLRVIELEKNSLKRRANAQPWRQ